MHQSVRQKEGLWESQQELLLQKEVSTNIAELWSILQSRNHSYHILALSYRFLLRSSLQLYCNVYCMSYLTSSRLSCGLTLLMSYCTQSYHSALLISMALSSGQPDLIYILVMILFWPTVNDDMFQSCDSILHLDYLCIANEYSSYS